MIQHLLTLTAVVLALTALAFLVVVMAVVDHRLDRLESAPPAVEQGQKRA